MYVMFNPHNRKCGSVHFAIGGNDLSVSRCLSGFIFIRMPDYSVFQNLLFNFLRSSSRTRAVELGDRHGHVSQVTGVLDPDKDERRRKHHSAASPVTFHRNN